MTRLTYLAVLVIGFTLAVDPSLVGLAEWHRPIGILVAIGAMGAMILERSER